MPRNYDTTGHKPYPRITKIEIAYSEDGASSVEYVEQMAVVDGDGKVHHIGSVASRHTLNIDAVPDPLQIISPATGQPIPGHTVTRQQLMLGLLACLRADQLRRDAQDEAQPVGSGE